METKNLVQLQVEDKVDILKGRVVTNGMEKENSELGGLKIKLAPIFLKENKSLDKSEEFKASVSFKTVGGGKVNKKPKIQSEGNGNNKKFKFMKRNKPNLLPKQEHHPFWGKKFKNPEKENWVYCLTSGA